MPVPDDTASHGEATDTAPPWLESDGTVDVTLLDRNHDGYPADRSYRSVVRYTVVNESEPFHERTVTWRTVVGSEGFLVAEIHPGTAACNRSVSVADGRGYLRFSSPDGTRYATVRSPRDRRSYGYASDPFRRFLADVRVDVAVLERDGRTAYRLHTAGRTAPEQLTVLGHSVSNYTATAYVTPAGFVRSLAVQYERPEGEQTTRVRVRYEYTLLDASATARPDWVSEVPTATPTSGPTAASQP